MNDVIIFPESNSDKFNQIDEHIVNEMCKISYIVFTKIFPSKISKQKSDKQWRDSFKKNVRNGTKYIIYLDERNSVRGFLVFTPNYKQKPEIFINDIIIKPQYQGDGVTLPKLLSVFIKEIEHECLKSVTTYANNLNIYSQHLIEKIGFIQYKSTQNGKSYKIKKQNLINKLSKICSRY